MNINDLAKSFEIKKGDFFTVVEWTSHKDNSYKGDLLEAVVVDLPFIRVINHSGYFWSKKLTIDLNRVEVMPLSKEFAQDVIADNVEKERLKSLKEEKLSYNYTN